MNRRSKNVLETLISVRTFKAVTGVPTNARAEILFTQVNGVITEMESHGTDQASGVNTTASGVDFKRTLSVELRDKLREISDTAQGLDPEAYPAAEAQFRMPRSRTYQALLAGARAFLQDIGPVKAGFVECGMPVDFDETLTELVAEFASATQRHDDGLTEQVGGTAGLDAKARRGVEILGRLDAVMHNLLRSNPSLRAAWDTASHIEREPRSAETAPPAVSTPAAAVSSGASAPAAAPVPA